MSLAIVQCWIGAVSPAVALPAMLAMGALGLVIGVMQVAILAVGRAVRGWLHRWGWSAPTALATTVAVFAAPGLVIVAAAALSGRRMAALPFRFVLLAGSVLSVLVLIFLLTRAAAVRARRIGARQLGSGGLAAVLALLVALAACSVWADNRLLVRRYEWFHATLELAAFASLQAAGFVIAALNGKLVEWRGIPRRRRSISLTIVVGAFALVAGWRSAALLWEDDRDAARAQLFTADGAVATALELLRPSEGLAARSADRSWKAILSGRQATSPPSGVNAALRGADVILVTIDALRADHLGFTGYARATSPSLDALAARSTVFERAYTPSPHTSFAISSILTGRHSFSLARADLLDGATTLADVFAASGYRTVGLFPPAVFFVERERFRALEHRRYGFTHTRYESLDERRDAPIRTDQAIEALESAGRQPTFMWIHYFGPHEPYLHHATLAGSPIFGPRAMDRYDEEIVHVDRELGRLIEHLDRRKRPYIMIVTADHGEEFGDHGGAYHGTSLFDEQIRVPLVVRVPDGVGHRIATPASTVDIAATLTSLVGLPWRPPEDGIDRAAAILGQPPPPELAPPVMAELESMKALMIAERKLVCDTARDYCRLFDLGKDPAERHDIATQHPAVVSQLRGTLEDWLRRAPDLESGRAVAALLWAAQRWDPPAIARLGQVLDASAEGIASVAERRAAAKLMARGPRDEHRPALSTAFTADPDALVRSWAAVALAGLGDVPAITALDALRLARHGDPELGSRIALALAGAAHHAAGQALVDVLPHETDVNLRCRLVTALAGSAHPNATQILLDAYANVRSRVCVAKALAAVRDEAALGFLIARLRDESYSNVRVALVRAIATWNRGVALEALRDAFGADGDDAVTAAAAKALAGLGAAVPTTSGRRVRVPPGARELWVVAKPAPERELRVSSHGHIHIASKTGLEAAPDGDVYQLPLVRGQTNIVELPAPATHALFR